MFKDFQFKDLMFLDKMVTPLVMTVIYWIGCVFLGLGSLIYLITRLASGSVTQILIGIITTPIILVLGFLYIRILCEVLIVIFKIHGNLQKIADKE